MPAYERLANIAMHHGSRRILELGAGLSTAVWANFANRTGAKVTTVDADFSAMRSYVKSKELNALIDEHIKLVKGVTITADQLRAFYENEHNSFGGVEAKAIAETIDAFSIPQTTERVDRVNEFAGSPRWTMREIFVKDNRAFRFPPKLMDKLSPSGKFAKDIAFLEEHPMAEIDSSQSWDFVFFDSGEVSSNIEWLNLKDKIAVGGLAAFHDIYFPKSIKNFLPCAAITADPAWNVILLDEGTIQGLLIAQRIS
jgi:predicted O-methyltransferase YrrM